MYILCHSTYYATHHKQTFHFLIVLIISVIFIKNNFAVTLRSDGTFYTALCRNAFEDAEPVPETPWSHPAN